ncbi:MAG: hypothetical protein EU544_02625 [Promethearchaeota archaeon]|nr:MAG: hypothetical protein EU544_02625 [Candidatus Lokiarchaeota archaeon]
MERKKYVCSECGYEFPPELGNLINEKVQVYCERCGAPFKIAGIKFKKDYTQHFFKKERKPVLTDKQKSSFESAIEGFNKISFLPILIFSIVSLGMLGTIAADPGNWALILMRQLSLGIAGLLITFYDKNYISKRIKEKKYDEIALDAFCIGILGCVIFGTGVLILLKGILIVFYVILTSEEKENRLYKFGLKLKNSLNNFSAFGGIIIIILTVAILGLMVSSVEELSTLEGVVGVSITVFIVFLVMGLAAIFIDITIKKRLAEQDAFTILDFVFIFTLGIVGTIFFSAGIFILFKGIIIFFLLFGNPPEPTKAMEIPIAKKKELEKIAIVNEGQKEDGESRLKPQPIKPKKEIEDEKEKERSQKKSKKEVEEKIEEVELKLHESLLPVKDEKDKKVVKSYFSKIFSILSKDVRKQIIELKIPKEEKKQLLQELAFLTAEQQLKYIETISDIYKEIPKKLIQRVKSLPNIKPEHYQRIMDQLKQMDYEEQLEFVHYLETNTPQEF